MWWYMQQLPYLLRIGPVAQSHLCCSSFVVLRIMTSSMEKLELTGQNLVRVFNFKSGRVHSMHFLCYGVKLTNLKLKTRPSQLLGSLLLHITLPASLNSFSVKGRTNTAIGGGLAPSIQTLRSLLRTPRGLCYKTFYGLNLRILIIS